jgi:hypothetical protein
MSSENTNKLVVEDELTNFLLKKIKKVRGLEYNNLEVINAFDLTRCQKRIFYSITGEQKQDVKMSGFNGLDNIYQKSFRNKWFETLELIEDVKILGKDIVVGNDKYCLKSTIDAILQIKSLATVFMARSLSSSDFQLSFSLISKPRRAHIIELMMNMWMVEIPHGLILYENRDTLDITLFHVVPEMSLIRAYCDKCKHIADAKIGFSKDVKRAYLDRDNDECGSCEYSNKCWES